MDILLTLDYELFLNDISGTVHNCLVKPISELQEICDKYNIHYTVFVDAAYLYALNENRNHFKELDADYQAVCNNIRWIHSKGHEVELHIHPQWFFSEYHDGVWILDWAHYSLADVGSERAVYFFKEAKGLLDGVLREKTSIFRAGGYTLQGFDYVRAFSECGIVADSSVLPGQKEITTTHRFDYSGVSKTPYQFTDDVCKSESEGCFTEIPISIAKKVFLLNYLSIKKRFMADGENVNWGDGGDNPIMGITNKLKKRLASFAFFKQPRATIDYQSFFFLRPTYENSRKYGYMTIIGHPKNFSPSSLGYFDSFVKDCLEAGDRFITAKEYCENLNKDK